MSHFICMSAKTSLQIAQFNQNLLSQCHCIFLSYGNDTYNITQGVVYWIWLVCFQVSNVINTGYTPLLSSFNMILYNNLRRY